MRATDLRTLERMEEHVLNKEVSVGEGWSDY